MGIPTSRLQNIRYLVRVCFLVHGQPSSCCAFMWRKGPCQLFWLCSWCIFCLDGGFFFVCFSHVVKCISLLLWLLDFEAWLERLPLLHGYKGIDPNCILRGIINWENEINSISLDNDGHFAASNKIETYITSQNNEDNFKSIYKIKQCEREKSLK